MEIKNQRFNFVLSKTDDDMLRELSEHSGESSATVVRRAIRMLYAATFGEKRPKSKK